MGMTNEAASILSRLKNEAKRRGEDPQALQLQYAHEGVLRRLQVSAFKDKLIVKGSNAFLAWTGVRTRPTRDLDFEGLIDNNRETVSACFREILSIVPTDPDHLVFDVPGMSTADIVEYRGIQVKVIASLGKTKFNLLIEIGFNDQIHPAVSTTQIDSLLGLGRIDVPVYPPETSIAEKFQIMVNLGTANSRLKDFYDIAFLSQTREFDGVTLATAVSKTFHARDTSLNSTGAPPDVFRPTFAKEPKLVQGWTAFISKNQIRNAGTFTDAVQQVAGLLREVYDWLAAGNPPQGFRYRWAKRGPWTPIDGGP